MHLTISSQHEYKIVNALQTGEISFYKAIDMNFNRYVGVKEIQLPKGKSEYEIKKHFNEVLNEIKAMICVSEMTMRVPSVFETYYDHNESKIYIIMQWIKGVELTEKMKTSKPNQFIQWMIDLCEVLLMMANKNLYHKDIKPSNIMIDSTNQLHLIDFNISLLKPNLYSGTINYKAPEMKSSFSNQLNKVDMFSIGVMLYEYFTEQLPIEGNEYVLKTSRLFRKKPLEKWTRFEEPKSINPNIPNELNNLIVKCMSYSPDDRYESYYSLKKELISIKRLV